MHHVGQPSLFFPTRCSMGTIVLHHMGQSISGLHHMVHNMGAEMAQIDDRLAAMLAPPGSKYVLVCRECRKAWPYKRDCKTTKAAREGNASCPECGEPLDFPIDAKGGS